MSTFTVSIGRRQGTGDPLSKDRWRDFRVEVETLIQDQDGELFFAGLGGGVHAGVYEESATWVFGHEALPATFSHRLATLASRYEQESIALTEGQTTFVEASLARRAA